MWCHVRDTFGLKRNAAVASWSSRRGSLSHVAVFVLVVCCALMRPEVGAGAVWNGLKDSPISKFTEQDMTYFEAARTEALEKRADGESVSWANPETGNSGTVTPIRTYERAGSRCRVLEIVNRAGKQRGESRFNFCEQTNGEWKVVSP